jgi:hypothetical protein
MKPKRKSLKERKPVISERDNAGLLRTLRPRRPNGGRVTLAKYARLNRAA